MIKSGYLVKGQRKVILVVKSQSKYLAGQHFDQGRRSEYRIYRSATPLCRINTDCRMSVPVFRRETLRADDGCLRGLLFDLKTEG